MHRSQLVLLFILENRISKEISYIDSNFAVKKEKVDVRNTYDDR